MTQCSITPKAASYPHAPADARINVYDELDAFEAIVRAAHDADRRSATSTLITNRWH